MGRYKFRDRDRGSIHHNSHTTGLSPTTTAIIPIVIVVLFILFFCFFKFCRKQQPVIATPTTNTVVATTPKQYPQQAVAMHTAPKPHRGGQYQHVPVQPGYPAQPAAHRGQQYVAALPKY
ncbi:unnamed protein product [Ophioblennius macclurei]